MSNPYNVPAVRHDALAKWQRHPFYETSVVLGLDVGLEGIGGCVRSGPEILYAKTWLYDVPEAARLEGRRQLRGARHCRANRKTRLHRLRELFERHGLPWLADDSSALRNSDPFFIRHRAVASANGLASREALSIAIRHCVSHRCHDYDYFSVSMRMNLLGSTITSPRWGTLAAKLPFAYIKASMNWESSAPRKLSSWMKGRPAINACEKLSSTEPTPPTRRATTLDRSLYTTPVRFCRKVFPLCDWSASATSAGTKPLMRPPSLRAGVVNWASARDWSPGVWKSNSERIYRKDSTAFSTGTSGGALPLTTRMPPCSAWYPCGKLSLHPI